MGTKFRTMLAPIGMSTGDGRRFAAGGISLAPTPFPFEWARVREGGHNGAVVIGAVHEATVATVANALKDGWTTPEVVKSLGLDDKSEAVWARGEIFDDVDREETPRLAEDVAEALHLITNGVLGPSVDLDSFEGVPVFEGSDEPITYEDLERAYEETGEEPKIELLVTEGRVRAATLVSIPAFMETCQPLELMTEEPAEGLAASERAALIASVAAPELPPAAMFDPPKLDGPTPITIDPETGRIFGHIAEWRTCHVGYSDVCITPPRDPGQGYSWFNRFPVETDAGTVWAGRLTVGGRHPGLNLTASATMAQYDVKTVAAHVRASEDEFGIVVSGTLVPDLDPAARSVLSRRKVSGDWRETPEGLSLVELLALSPGPRRHSEPGFPVAATHSRNGRQVSLTAALGPDPDVEPRRLDPAEVRAEVRAALAAEREREAQVAALTAILREDAERTRTELAGILEGQGEES